MNWWEKLPLEYQDAFMESCAQQGYEAYGDVTGGKNYHGGEMPSWEDLPQKIKIAWIAAVWAILEEADYDHE